MELPSVVQDCVLLAAQGVPMTQLARAAEALSGRYRSEVMDGAWHVPDDLAARAYLTVRFPATFAAVAAAMQAAALLRPDFAPLSQLDVGSGPGTAFWAAQSVWPELKRATLWEGSASMREWGERLARYSPVSSEWHSVDVRRSLPESGRFDLVTLAYVLNELNPTERASLITDLWARTDGLLLIVEPGTTAGWQRILELRKHLLDAGASLLAPCPHAQTCPVHAPDWCHFSVRVARSSLHRRGKGAELSYEDEKFIYLAVSRTAGESVAGRVLSVPHRRSGLVQLKLCTAAGTLEQRTLSKRDGERFKQARKLEWGDALGADG